MAIEERLVTEKGLGVLDKSTLREVMKTEKAKKEYAKHHSNWVIQGWKVDQEKHK